MRSPPTAPGERNRSHDDWASGDGDNDDPYQRSKLSPPHMDVTSPRGLGPPPKSSPAAAAGGGAPAGQAAASQQEWREYVSGGAASVVAIVVTFPINKAMFRQQVHNISPVQAVRQMVAEGAHTVYRGLPSPLLMKTASQSVMFGSYATYTRLLGQHASPPLGRTQCKLAGAALAGASETALMPLERVQVLMQDQKYNKEFRNTPHALWALRRHGAREYYRGMSAILLRNSLGNMIFFTQRERIKSDLPERWARHGSYKSNVADFFGGAVLGAFISTAFYPVNVTKAHMQLKIGGPFARLHVVFLTLLRERGWRGMFRGVHTNYTRSFLSWGIVNVTYENILYYLQRW